MRQVFSLIVKIGGLVVIAAIVYRFIFAGDASPALKDAAQTDTIGEAANMPAPPSDTIADMTEAQAADFKVEAVITRIFRAEKEAVGNITYQEKNALHEPSLNTSSKFLVANVHENDSPFIHAGQPIKARMMAYPDHIFTGKVSALGVTAYDTGGNPAIDPNTHRIAVRCEVADPKNELYPGMLATLVIEVGEPQESVAVPKNGVVREGDGTMTAWVTVDRRHFKKRIIKVGLQQETYDQILDGLKPGELVATDNAVFLSNMHNDASND